jgi:guanylate kinase
MSCLLTFTGPSGTGKTTIVSKLSQKSGFVIVESTTTRARRSTDLPGDY